MRIATALRRVSLLRQLRQAGIAVTGARCALPVMYKDVRLDCGYRMDVVVESELILEIQGCRAGSRRLHEAQMLTYLKLARLRAWINPTDFNSVVLKDGIDRYVLCTHVDASFRVPSVPFVGRSDSYDPRRPLLDPVRRHVRHRSDARCRLASWRFSRAAPRSRRRWRAPRRGSASCRPTPPRRSPKPPPQSPPIRLRSISTGSGARPRRSATRSCRWCANWPSKPAPAGAFCIGARRRRTSWTPPRCCRSATGSS